MHLLLTLVLPAMPFAAVDPAASGISLSYIHMAQGEADLGGDRISWDQGMRVELQFRDYFFANQQHHPFYELGFFLERHSGADGGWDVQAKTMAIKGAIGSAIPLWGNGDIHVGLAPQISLHAGRTTLDTQVSGKDVSGEAFRYGTSAGLDGWMVFAGNMTLGVGPFASYWQTRSLSVLHPDGSEDSVSPSGWDVGGRLLFGIIF